MRMKSLMGYDDYGEDGFRFVSNWDTDETDILRQAAKKTGASIELRKPTHTLVDKERIAIWATRGDLSEFWHEYRQLGGRCP